ncbi:MAG: mevalonate kinase [Motiliproteus sp.]
MIARAPAKAIVSGEHAVVYGAPALAIAVNRHAQAYISVAQDHSSTIDLELADIGFNSQLDRTALLERYHGCQQRYQHFLKGECPISEVLPQADSLYQCAIADFIQLLDSNEDIKLCVKIASDIPLGAGMGSSAATVAAMLKGLATFFDIKLPRQQLFEMTHRAEQLQHGRSSGIDPAVCCFGGLIRFHQGDIQQRNLPTHKGWYLLDSGRPEVTTGVCGEQVRRDFGASEIWTEFTAVTNGLEKALLDNNSDQIQSLVRENQRLLVTIGVVPEAVQGLIAEIEQHGGAAKVSGAGAVAGDNAGLILIYQPDANKLPAQLFGKEIRPLVVDYQGAEIESGKNC